MDLKKVAKSNISLEENSSPMTKFRLKRRGDKWFGEVIARVPCAKKQAKEVTNPIPSLKENSSCFRTTSNQKMEKPVSDDPSIHLSFVNSQYTEVIRKTNGASSSYVQNEPLDQKSYMDALGGEEGIIKKPRPYSSHLIQREERNNVGRTKKRRGDLHQKLFKPNGLQDGTKLAYSVNGKAICTGYKKGNGIVCSHCDKKMRPSAFETHAGYSKNRQAYKYIYTADGQTLHEIALRLSEDESIQSNMSSSDDKCAVCGVGGELFKCGGCPCAYHAVCLGLESIPSGDWHCPFCTENIGPNGRDPSPVISQPDRVSRKFGSVD
ncbi:uncharacterized protein LOC141691380 [Apium graveolens]|uniref:uncharacterized protein LOC141691380 n=1 Tax=Apium graveolens TaxID=4045 RepID=UPI003D7A9EB9